MATSTSPRRARHHWSYRSLAERLLCRMAMRSPKRSFNRDANTGVSEISGTSRIACSPRFTAARINSIYTSVFPEPVTPSRTNGANVPRVAWTASMAARCSSE